MEILAETPQKMPEQARDIFTTIAKWRNVDRENIEPEVKILTELLALNGSFNISVGRCNNPHIDVDIAITAETSDHATLKHPQQLDLQGHIHFTDFIEEGRTAVRIFKQSYLTCLYIGKRTPFVTEEFGLQQVEWQRPAVDFNKGPLATRRQIMDRLRYQFFAGATFAGNQNRCRLVKAYRPGQPERLSGSDNMRPGQPSGQPAPS